MLPISRDGLRRRARYNSSGEDESGFPGAALLDRQFGITPAEALLAEYRDDWHGDIDRIYAEHAY